MKRNDLFLPLAVFCAALFLASCEQKAISPEFIKDMTLVWSDEFDISGAPDEENWNYSTGGGGWGNGELQYYTDKRSNSYVSDGTLKIEAVKEDSGKWTSARINSRWKKRFKYGYIEFRAKLPTQKGSWPALWMMSDREAYGSWPRSGEIDVMEYAVNFWKNKAYGTCHGAGGYGGNAFASSGIPIKAADKRWHNYGILWTKDRLAWIYDGKEFLSYENPHDSEYPQKFWPFDREFYIIMNVAMGGTLGLDVPKETKKCLMEVDYVRWYQ